MNKYLEQDACCFLKEKLAKLDENNHCTFRLMYSPKKLDRPINDVIDSIPNDRLDWAMIQVQNSVNKIDTLV
jgi:hypothetical protein